AAVDRTDSPDDGRISRVRTLRGSGGSNPAPVGPLEDPQPVSRVDDRVLRWLAGGGAHIHGADGAHPPSAASERAGAQPYRRVARCRAPAGATIADRSQSVVRLHAAIGAALPREPRARRAVARGVGRVLTLRHAGIAGAGLDPGGRVA